MGGAGSEKLLITVCYVCTLFFFVAGGGAINRRAVHGMALLLSAIVMLPTIAESFNMAPHVVRSLRNHGVPRPIPRSPMAQSASVELADDTTRLPDIARAVFENDTRPVLLYDGVCNMCNGFVNLFLDVDKDEKFRFSALQSQTGRALLSLSGRSADDISRSV